MMIFMKIPLTKYGLPQVAVFPAMVLVVMAIILFAGKKDIMTDRVVLITEIVLIVVLAWVLAFFRDPQRDCPQDASLLLSPADGVVSDIETIDHELFEGGKAIRIGIFLNIFNVHINRMPCPVRVDKITYFPGEFKNAIDPESARVNEANQLELTRMDEPCDKLIVRQISGAIARRIVCKAKEGQEFIGGEQFGMIKFGSRTELYLPASDEAEVMVEIGQKVKAGLSTFVKYSTEQ
jgi:phosphatidylserine decarboxylase